MEQPYLFDKVEMPRRKNIKRMAVVDASADWHHVNFECHHCGHKHGWEHYKNHTLTELRRGIPCPECNEEEKQ